MNELQKKLISRNNIKFLGEGSKTLFLVHGYGCNQEMYRFITPAYAAAYRIVLIDLVGTGNSDDSQYDFEKYATLEGYANDILEICHTFDLKNINIVGHSVSAMICTLAVNKNPAIFNSITMICPSPRYINDVDYNGGFEQSDIDDMIALLDVNYLGWVSNITPVIAGSGDHASEQAELENSFCRNNPEVAKHFARVTFTGDNREDIKKIQKPCLIIQSKIDSIASPEVGNYLHQNIKGSKIVVIETIGHVPHMSDATEVIAALNSFLNGIN